MLESILLIRCMVLVSTDLQMGIDTKELGMRVEGKDLGCTHLEMGKHSLVIGRMEFLTSQAHRAQHILFLLWLFIILKYSMQYR